MADPVKAIMDAISAVAGVPALMPAIYRSRGEGAAVPPYGLVERAETEPLVEMAVFDGPQVEWHNVDVAFWTSSPANCRAWGELVKAAISDWGTITVVGYGEIPGVYRGRMSYSEEVPPDSNAGLQHVCRTSLRFAVEYTAPLG